MTILLAHWLSQRLQVAAARVVYSHVEANLHWELFQFLGKLRPTVYVLRHALRAD